ncbi:MAG: TonB-dependent receptor [Bacteroidia bacterium]
MSTRRFSVLLLMSLLWGQVEDSVRIYDLDTVRIEGLLSSTSGETSADKVVRYLPATQLAYRSVPFAQEVVYQGFLPTQTQITIGGMRVLPACVDRMDPVLTFLEAAVVEGVDWRRATKWGGTPTLDIELFSPTGPKQGQASVLVGDNYHRLFATLKHRRQIGRWGLAGALTSRLGGDYRVGAWSLSPRPISAWPPDTLLSLPSFRKFNVYAALSYSPSEAHRIEGSYLGDYFYHLAYPALIMDANHSAMHLINIGHIWRDISEFRVYASTVFHDMTDENRSLSEIQHRIIMPGMYMPMKGLTRTAGAVWRLNWIRKENFSLAQHSELVRGSAYADMTMIPLQEGQSFMRLLNLADICFNQGGSALIATCEVGRWLLQAEGRWNFLTFSVEDTVGFIPLRSYQEVYAGASQPRCSFSVYEIATRTRWHRFGHTAALSLSHGTRAPTHTELYAYYLYVPMDNSILMGSSTLNPEKLLRTEIEYAYEEEHWQVHFGWFTNFIWDYIAPVTFMEPQTSANRTPQAWRILRNTGQAYTTGFTLRGSVQIRSHALIEGWSGYTFGWNQTLREPLPWIHPLFGRVRYTHRYHRHQGSIELYASARQTRLSRTIYLENATPAYWLLHLRYGYTLWQKGQTQILLTASVENLLNAYGWDHLSVNDMPFLGRVVRAGVSMSW